MEFLRLFVFLLLLASLLLLIYLLLADFLTVSGISGTDATVVSAGAVVPVLLASLLYLASRNCC
jgi:hypothetical protein